MAIGFVASWTSGQFNNNTGGTLTGRTSTAGNFVAIVAISSDTAATTTHSQTGSVQTARTDNPASGGTVWTKYIENIVGGASHTITLTSAASSFSVLNASEYNGIATSSSLDKTNVGTGSSTTLLSAATATTTQSDELLIGGGTMGTAGTGAWVAGASYNLRGNISSGAAGAVAFLEDRIVAASGAYTSGATKSGDNNTWTCQVSTFKGSLTGGVPPSPMDGPGGMGPQAWQWQQSTGPRITSVTTPQDMGTTTQTQTPTITTVTSHLLTLSATETQTPTITRVNAFLKTLTATETQTPTIIRQTSKTLTATETQSPTLTASRAYLRTLTATETQTPTISTPVTRAKTLTVTETQTPTITRVNSFLRTLTATETQSPTISRVTAHLLTLTATETQTITFNRVTAHLLTLTATDTQTPTLTASRAFLRTLTVTETQTPTITATFQAGAAGATVPPIPDLQHTLNRLASTLALSLDAQAAANVWAGTTGLELVHALNRKAGTSKLELNGVAKLLASQLSGDPTMDAQGALASIPLPTGPFTLAPLTFGERAAAKTMRVVKTVKRHKVAASVGGVGVVGTASMLLRGILL